MENLNPGSGILDLAIIGGGPAGTAAALEARRCGLRVAIWERGRFPRDKVCGEFISPEALPLLQTEVPRTVIRGAGICGAELISDSGLTRAFRLPQPALGLSRLLLDDALWKKAEQAGVDAHQGGCVRRVRKLAPARRLQAGGWEIESAGGSFCRAKALIIACGRWWMIEGLYSPPRPNVSAKAGDWIGAKAHFAGLPPRGKVEMYFFHGGYCGLAPVENGACNVCCLVSHERFCKAGSKRLDDFAAWLVQLAHQPALEARLRGSVQISPSVTTAPVRLVRGQAAQNGALMVGDASGFLDPFTGDGISMALHSGRLAAQSVARSLSGGPGNEPVAEVYRESLAKSVRRSYKIAAMARSLILGPAWLQNLATAPLPWIGKTFIAGTRWRGKTTSSF